MGDFDGDGKADIVGVAGSETWVMLSNYQVTYT